RYGIHPISLHYALTSVAEQIMILDFGSQYTQLIARRVRELDVYCEIHPFNKIPEIGPDIKGIILSGSPCSVNDTDAPDIDLNKLDRKITRLNSSHVKIS